MRCFLRSSFLKKLSVVCMSAILLSGCAHKRQDQGVYDVNAAYGDNNSAGYTHSAGMSENEQFADHMGGGRSLLSRRVYYFAFNSNIVNDSDKPAIFANANYLVAHPNVTVTVEGNTDPRGSREYNIGLGERRARAVADLLLSRGVRRSQIHIVSYGYEKLASPGHTEADYQLDRRVALVYRR